MTALIWSDQFRLHDTGAHPENAQRLVAIRDRLQRAGLLQDRVTLDPRPATVEDVALVHEPDYIEAVERLARAGGGYLDPDTVVSPATYEVALLAAGAAITAVNTVLDGEVPRVFAFPRPPGHHAEPNRGMGFCVFNSIAIGARHALQRRGLERVAIVDWDVHHGNGTQTAFYDTARVLFVSLHQWPLYPGTGRADETGRGEGLGYTLNLPLPHTGDADYLRAFDQFVGPRLREYHPDLLMVSAGFDAHREDPLAMMDVTERGFAGMAARARHWADELCGGRLVVLLEGGYNLRALAASVEATLRAFDSASTAEESAR